MRKQLYFKEDESDKLERLSEILERSRSDVVRMAIDNLYHDVVEMRKKRQGNPLIELIGICSSEVPADLSADLDTHLYGEKK